MNKTTNSSWRVQDFITLGMYTAIYFVVVCVGTLCSFLLLPGFSSIFTPAIVSLLAGTVFFVLEDKLPRFGAITVMGTTFGLFFLLSGHFVLAFLPSLLCSLIADGIAKIGQYRTKGWNFFSYVVFSFGLTGPILPLWWMKDLYIKRLVARGKDQAYIERIFSPINGTTFWLSMGAIVVAALIGATVGFHFYQKHFTKGRKKV